MLMSRYEYMNRPSQEVAFQAGGNNAVLLYLFQIQCMTITVTKVNR